MGNLIRLAMRKLGMSVETRPMDAREVQQARLLGDPVAMFGHAADPKSSNEQKSVLYVRRQDKAA